VQTFATLLALNAEPKVSQTAFRFYADGTESGSSALAAQNTNYTADVSSGDFNLGLRARLQETAGAKGLSSDDYQLQYELNDSGTYYNIGDAPSPAGATVLNSSTYESGSGGFIATHTLSGFSCSGTDTQLLVFGFNRNPLSDVTGITANGNSMTKYDDSINANVVAIEAYRYQISNSSFDIVCSTPSFKLQAMVAVAIGGAQQGNPIVGTAKSSQFASSGTVSYRGRPGNLLIVTIALQSNYAITPTNNTELQDFDHADSNLGRCYVGYAIADGTSQSLGGSWGTNDNYRILITEVAAAAVPSYYFDASDAGPTDPDSVWTNDANAFDGNVLTDAICSTDGSTSSNFLLGEGTDAPPSGMTIGSVQARVINVFNAFNVTTNAAIYTDGLGELLGTATATTNLHSGDPVTLSTPSGGWTWAKIQALEVKIYATGTDATYNARPAKIVLDVYPTAAAPVIGFNSASLTDGNATTNRLGAGTGSFVAGEISEDGLVDNHQLTASNYTEHLYSLTLVSSALANNDTLDFRVLRNGATTGMTYTVTPRITASKSSGPTINRSDSVTVTESVSISVSAAPPADLSINRSESVTVTESTARLIDPLLINRSDSTTLIEAVTVRIPELIISASDSATLTESVSVRSENRTDSTENITITEAVTVRVPEYLVNRSDTVTITESVQREATNRIVVSDTTNATDSSTVSIAATSDLVINVTDSSTVTEATAREAINRVSASDTATVSESITVTPAAVADISISVSDTTTITESVQRAATNRVSTSDSVSITENTTALIPTLFVGVTESATVTESAIASIPIVGTLTVVVSDTTSAAELLQTPEVQFSIARTPDNYRDGAGVRIV
jgi:hypothetical protein